MTGQWKKIFSGTALGIVSQLVNYSVPIVVVPIIISRAGLAGYGLISVGQSIQQFFLLFVDLGFNYSGVSHLASHQNDNKLVSVEIKGITIIKLILVLISVLINLVIGALLGKTSVEHSVFILQSIYIAAYAFFPVYIMQAYFDLTLIAVGRIVNKLLYLLGVFILLKNYENISIVPLVNGLSLLPITIITFIYSIRRYKVNIYVDISKNAILDILKRSFGVFTSISIASIYRYSTPIVLKIMSSPDIVGIYSLAEKLTYAFQATLSPISQVVYPYMATEFSDNEKRGREIFRRIEYVYLAIGGFVSVAIAIFARVIYQILYGVENAMFAWTLQIMSFSLVFGMQNYLLGYIGLGNLKKEALFSKSLIIVASIYLIITPIVIKRNPVLSVFMPLLVEVILYFLLKHAYENK